MPTLQDVAKKAGVSIATVSKVLSNTPYFTEETRDKVMAAVKELNYVPNLAARALMTGKTRIIAVVFPYVYDAIFKDPLVMHILEGIEAECTIQGYNLLLSTPRLSESGPDEQYEILIRSGYIDGVIAIDNVPLASVASPLVDRSIPVVVIGHYETEYYVRGDDVSGGQQQMAHMLGLGHRHIGIITVPANMNMAINQRLEGLRLAATDAGVDFDALPVAYSDFSTTGGAKALTELMGAHPELTAIICLNDRMALGAIQQAQAHGLKVPDDLSVIGYDNLAVSGIVAPGLTTIDQHASTMGQTATRMLFDVLNHKQPSPAVLPNTLVERKSTGTPRSS